MDVFTTAVGPSGGMLPDDRAIDGLDLSPVLFAGDPSPRDVVPFYRYNEL
jgi:hypothetical protein